MRDSAVNRKRDCVRKAEVSIKKRTVTQSDVLPLDAGLRMNGRMHTSTHYAVTSD